MGAVRRLGMVVRGDAASFWVAPPPRALLPIATDGGLAEPVILALIRAAKGGDVAAISPRLGIPCASGLKRSAQAGHRSLATASPFDMRTFMYYTV